MAYTTIATIQSMAALLSVTAQAAAFTTPKLQAAIDLSTTVVESDLSARYDIPTLQSLSPVPGTLNLLSSYKALEMLFASTFSPVGKADAGTMYWTTKYNDLLQNVMLGKNNLINSDGSIVAPRDGIYSTHAHKRFGKSILGDRSKLTKWNMGGLSD